MQNYFILMRGILMRKIKVIHVLNTGDFSGAENVAISIIEKLNNSNIECFYVSLNGSIEKKLNEKKIIYIPLEKLNVKKLKKVLREIQPDIIHAHDFRASIISALCFPKGKIISHLHNNSPWLKKRGLYSWLFLASCFSYSEIFTVSKSIQEEYIFGKFIKNRIICIGNPLDANKIREKANENICNNDKYEIVFLGRLTDAKNIKLLIDIFKKIITIVPTVKIGIIGNGELYGNVKDELEIEIDNGNVNMLGFLENPYVILKNAKVLCLPSKWEGYGLAAFESLSVGTPVVCSGVGGLKDIIDDSCGKICLFDINEYVKESVKLITNNEYYEFKKKSALLKSMELSNISEYIQMILDIYHNIMEHF